MPVSWEHYYDMEENAAEGEFLTKLLADLEYLADGYPGTAVIAGELIRRIRALPGWRADAADVTPQDAEILAAYRDLVRAMAAQKRAQARVAQLFAALDPERQQGYIEAVRKIEEQETRP